MTASPEEGHTGEDSSWSGLVEGMHEVRIPVNDVWASRDWYVAVLGFESVLDVEEETAVVGVILRHPSGMQLGLHRDPPRAAAMGGFAALSLTVLDRDRLKVCAEILDQREQVHSPIKQGHLGWYLDIPDPDGILVRLHTAIAIDADEA